MRSYIQNNYTHHSGDHCKVERNVMLGLTFYCYAECCSAAFCYAEYGHAFRIITLSIMEIIAMLSIMICSVSDFIVMLSVVLLLAVVLNMVIHSE